MLIKLFYKLDFLHPFLVQCAWGKNGIWLIKRGVVTVFYMLVRSRSLLKFQASDLWGQRPSFMKGAKSSAK